MRLSFQVCLAPLYKHETLEQQFDIKEGQFCFSCLIDATLGRLVLFSQKCTHLLRILLLHKLFKKFILVNSKGPSKDELVLQNYLVGSDLRTIIKLKGPREIHFC